MYRASLLYFGAIMFLASSTLKGTEWQPAPQPDLKQRLDAAKPLPVEDVCVPVKSVRVGETMLVPNPDGKTYDVLQWYFKGYSGPTAVYIIDLGTGQIKKDSIPLERQIHICGRVLGPDGKLYITTPDWKKGMELYVYDPAKNELTCRGVIAPGLGGENRPMVIGTDGKIYGAGSYADSSRAGVYQLDTATGKVTVYGPVGPSHKPAGCWCQSLGADDEYIYVTSGKVPWYLIAYHKATGQEKVLLETDRVLGNITVQQLSDGCVATASHLKGKGPETVRFWLYKGQAIPQTDSRTPWVTKPAVEIFRPPRPELYCERLDPDPQGRAELWYRNPTMILPPHQAVSGANEGWKVARMDVEMFPMVIRRLTEMPDGRLLGTADCYLGNFIFDPATGRSEHLGKIPLSHYSTAFLDGKVYMSGYPASPVYVFDPTKPWTVGHGTLQKAAPVETDPASNPRKVTRLSEWTRTHKMYGAAVGSDGKVYFGGQCLRVANGGGIGWWDPKTEQAGGIWRPFTAYAIHFLIAASDGQFLVASTQAVRDDSRNNWTPEQGKLFIYDVRQGKILHEIEPVLGAKCTGPIVEAKPGFVLGTTTDPKNTNASLLYGVEVATGKVLFTSPLPGLIAWDITQGRYDFRKGPDGFIWTYINDVLVKINPEDLRIEVVGKVASPGKMAFAGQDVYLAGTESLRRIKKILK